MSFPVRAGSLSADVFSARLAENLRLLVLYFEEGFSDETLFLAASSPFRLHSSVIGKNDAWKQEANMGKRNNQNFVSIPHARFISMLTYKAELAGIMVKITEESYTSKASFLDRDEMPVYDPNQTAKPKFSGKRIKRGLYRAADGTLINADCNGSGNIIRKVAPDAFQQAEGVEDGKRVVPLVVHPVRLSFPSRSQKASNGVSKRSIER